MEEQSGSLLGLDGQAVLAPSTLRVALVFAAFRNGDVGEDSLSSSFNVGQVNDDSCIYSVSPKIEGGIIAFTKALESPEWE